MKQGRQLQGFTMLELMIAVVVIGILSAFAVPQTRNMLQNGRTQAAALHVADMFSFARANARATNATFLVFFGVDAENKALKDSWGNPASVLVVDDSPSPNCKIDGDEQTWAVPAFDSGIEFQLAQSEGASVIAGDVGAGNPVTGSLKGTSFTALGGGATSVRWVLFGSDGVPRRFDTGVNCQPTSTSEVGRGGGTVYIAGARPGESLSSGRQYAIELGPLGGVKTHRFDWARNQWRTR